MPYAPATTEPLVTRDAYHAARRVCATLDPDFYFATRLLPKREQSAALCLAAVVAQLSQIICPTPKAGEGDTCGDNCGCEPLEQRVAVCRAVIEHLQRGEPTGKPELDAFAGVLRAFDVPVSLFEQVIDGLAAASQTKRHATWSRLKDECDRTVGVMGLIGDSVLRRGAEKKPAGVEAHGLDVRVQQLLACCAAVRLLHLLEHIEKDYRRGKVLIPQDDLVKAKVTESDIARWVNAKVVTNDDAKQRLIAHLTDRATHLLQGGTHYLQHLGEPRIKRAAALWVRLTFDRIDSLRTTGTGVERSWWRRLRQLPAAVRLTGSVPARGER